MHNTAGGSLHRRGHNISKSSVLFRRDVEQPGAADIGRKWSINSAVETPLSALFTTNSLDIFYVYDTALSEIYLFSFWNFGICRMLDMSSPAAVNPAGDLLLCSHIDFSWISTGITLGGQAEKVSRDCRASHSDICVHTCTSSGENTEEL